MASSSNCRAVSAVLPCAVGAEFVDGLRRQTNVAHHRDLFIHQALDQWNALCPPSTHRFSTTLFNESQRVPRIVVTGMKCSVGHIGHQQGALDRSADGSSGSSLIERYRYGIAIAQHYVAEAIADQNINSCFVDDAGSPE